MTDQQLSIGTKVSLAEVEARKYQDSNQEKTSEMIDETEIVLEEYDGRETSEETTLNASSVVEHTRNFGKYYIIWNMCINTIKNIIIYIWLALLEKK